MRAQVRPTQRVLLLILVAGLLGGLWWWRGRVAPPAASGVEPGVAAQGPADSPANPAGPVRAAASPVQAQPAEAGGEKALWQARLQEADERLQTYRRYAQYPPHSRPASEHPDRLYPRAPLSQALPLGRPGSPGRRSRAVRVRLTQDRHALVADESARLALRCEDEQEVQLPCQVVQAVARPISQASDGRPQRALFAKVEFADDGRAGDARAGDGEYTATVQPGRMGLTTSAGPLVVTAEVRAGGEEGEASFDLLYTPQPPAVLTGQVHEALEGGSLVLSYGIEVAQPGRYVLHLRVDDAADQPAAYLEFNEELAAGPQRVRFVVFGKLVHDLKLRLPLKLRDLDGFLLRENESPDRSHLPMLAGVHHTTRSYPLESFSTAEWQSEQRSRNLQEFEKDAAEVRERLRAAGGKP